MADVVQTIEQATIKAKTIKMGKYHTFSLAHEQYGIGILKVKEINLD